MENILRKEERILLKLLRASINEGEKADRSEMPRKEEREFWQEVIRLAGAHAVVSLLYDTLVSGEILPDALMKSVEESSRMTVRSNYRLLFLTKYITEILEQNNIQAIALKGAATSSLYPVPELQEIRRCRYSGNGG